MLKRALIVPGNTILEPSAGIGSIADVIREQIPDPFLTCVEIVPRLTEILEVDYDFEPGEKATGPSYASGGEPAVGPSVSINAVVLSDVDEEGFIGECFLPSGGDRLRQIIGEMCWHARPREIINKTFDAAREAERDSGPDPDYERDARRDEPEHYPAPGGSEP